MHCNIQLATLVVAIAPTFAVTATVARNARFEALAVVRLAMSLFAATASLDPVLACHG